MPAWRRVEAAGYTLAPTGTDYIFEFSEEDGKVWGIAYEYNLEKMGHGFSSIFLSRGAGPVVSLHSSLRRAKAAVEGARSLGISVWTRRKEKSIQ